MIRNSILLHLCLVLAVVLSLGVSTAWAINNFPGRTPAVPIAQGSESFDFDRGFDLETFTNTRVAPPDLMLYFSPEFSMTLMNLWTPFWLRDADLASYNSSPGPFSFEFDGTPYGLRNLDAVDLEMSQYEEGSDDMLIYFSVREDHLLNNDDGSPFYMHKEDIAVLDTYTGKFEMILEGKARGILGIDALSVLNNVGEGGSESMSFVFSPTVDSYCSNGMNPPVFCHDEDLVKYDPNTNMFSIYVRGIDIGVGTLDAVDIVDELIYFSVKEPIFVYKPPFTAVYLKDGDVGIYDPYTQMVTRVFEGKNKGVFSIDALSMGYPDPQN
ncbi:MAG: hypothetical protein ABIK28_22320 [Planctomycetota bacterium]